MDERELLLDRLDTLHPNLTFDAILPLMMIRVAVDPVASPEDVKRRAIRVNHRDEEAAWAAVWTDNPAYSPGKLKRWKRTYNDVDITEQAAVGVMALLVDATEGMELLSVLQIGSGGDFSARGSVANGPAFQIECSGIRADDSPSGAAARQRLKEKGEQVLTNAPTGFASVTTFSHGPDRKLHSYLHFFEK